ncbi:D-alanine aminotransferase [hydrothermal vent metagenome]|uniref:D-alanine aminotransferase n=1 Tax=hydrothermal vent metagenome TaxID=652676 RepID=A0A3B1AZI5_9ZZZZ
MSNSVYLNGEFIPLAEARVSVMDRGFLFGDGVYEVIPAYGGCLFRLHQHLHRLENSLHGIRMHNPMSEAQWEQVLATLIAQYPGADQSIYLQVTRGASEVRDHAIPAETKPTVFAFSTPFHPVTQACYEHGIAAITLDDIRWRFCNIKATTLLANVLLRQEAKDRDAMEAILIRDGQAMEGTASNLFIVEDGRIITPPKGEHLLPGITRDLVLELAAEAEIPYSEATITAAQLDMADEVWLTSSTREIMPVTLLDDRSIGKGRPGPVWEKMIKMFQNYKEELRQ